MICVVLVISTTEKGLTNVADIYVLQHNGIEWPVNDH